MMSSMVWERPVLSLALLHLVSSVTPCCYVTSTVAVPGEQPIALALCCRRTVATCLTELPAQSC
jgi:hypothetical protein